MCYTTPGSMQGYIFLFENWLELQFSCSLFSMTCFQQWEWLLYRVLKGTIARWCYENLRREAASLKIQTCYRMHHARKNYVDVCSASTTIQSGLRGMGARIKLHFKRQTKAAVIIQVLQWCGFCSICTPSVPKKQVILGFKICPRKQVILLYLESACTCKNHLLPNMDSI